MITYLPPSWQPILAQETNQAYFISLQAFLEQERAKQTVYPPEQDVFNALHLTPYQSVKVLLLGQDPYHDEGQAHGLAFSVRPGVKPPPSLVNMFKELQADLGCTIPKHGCLQSWASQGVLLLNTVLTVRAHQPASHQRKGWETFTDSIIRALNQRAEPVVFVLWGNHAKKKLSLIDGQRHPVISGVHPSPLSAHNGFFGSRPYSQINACLEKLGQSPINWQLPENAIL
jgi:uracil-DNA glycosylase